MSDIIRVHDLLLRPVIGVSEQERRDRQDVLVSLELCVDTRPAGLSDDLDDAAVNYRTLVKQVIAMVEHNEFKMVEKLAEDVAALCLAEPKVDRVRVSVDKPGALRFARSVGVTIERSRQRD